MSAQVDIATNDGMIGPKSNHSYNDYNRRFSSNLGFNGCFVSTPNLTDRCGNISTSCLREQEEDEEHDTTPAQSDCQLNRLNVPSHIADGPTTDSPRVRRARYKISSLLNIKMASEGSQDDGRKSPKSPKSPKVRTPSIFRKNSIFGNTCEQNNKSNLKNDINGLSKSQLKKTVSFPSQSLQDISSCSTPKMPPRHRMSFSSTMFVNKITNGEETKELFQEMIRCIQADDCKIFKSLIKRKLIDINSITDDSFSLLHEASFKGCLKCMKTLIKNGCNINICDESGWTSLHASIFAKQIDAVKFLLDNSVSVNEISGKGWSPLHLGVFVGDLYIVHELIKYGGDPLLCNEKNISPFQLAINLEKSLILDYFLHLSCFLVEA